MKRLMTLAIPLVMAFPLAAQQPAGMPRDSARPGMMQRDMMDHMSQMNEMMAPMMRAMAFTPAQLLERKDVLGLTPPQVTRLTALRDEAKKAHDAAAAEAKQHREAMERSQANAADTAGLRTHFQAMHTAMGNAHWTMLRAAAQARGILNDAQRGRVDGWVDAMEMHHRMQMQHERDDDHDEHERHERP